MFLEISFEGWQPALHRLFVEDRLLLSACEGERRNAMTIGWGAFGVMWGEPIAFFAVRPSRYTFGLLKKGRAVTLSALPPEYGKAVTFCGTHTGREGDKLVAAGLTYTELPDGSLGIGEAALAVSGEVCCSHALLPDEIYTSDFLGKWYKNGDYHTLYYARIRHIYRCL